MEEEIRPGYVRVSEVLRPWYDFDKVPPEILERKMKIGTNVHNAIKMDYLGLPFVLNDEERGYFDSYLQWKSTFSLKLEMCEQRYYDDLLKITGCIDGIMSFPYDDEKVLVDWKTSSAFDSKNATVWQMQGTMYWHLLNQIEYPLLSNRFLFVQLSPTGDFPRVHEFHYKSEIMAKCAAAVELYWLFAR
jgi:hypothetical protein